jgi:predicted alpha/beta-fold hydrolase
MWAKLRVQKQTKNWVVGCSFPVHNEFIYLCQTTQKKQKKTKLYIYIYKDLQIAHIWESIHNTSTYLYIPIIPTFLDTNVARNCWPVDQRQVTMLICNSGVFYTWVISRSMNVHYRSLAKATS